jgi:hypothetical protein
MGNWRMPFNFFSGFSGMKLQKNVGCFYDFGLGLEIFVMFRCLRENHFA